MGTLLDWIIEKHPEALVADGLDEAIIGYEPGPPFRILYSAPEVVRVLMDRDGMDEETAWEFAHFNIFCAYVGPGTPVFLGV
jgi:hypothetical protein